MGTPIIAGLKMNKFFNFSTLIPDIAECFLKNEYMIVLVVIISTLVSSNIL